MRILAWPSIRIRRSKLRGITPKGIKKRFSGMGQTRKDPTGGGRFVGSAFFSLSLNDLGLNFRVSKAA